METTLSTVFVDTNVLFSGVYKDHTPPGKILNLHRDKKIRIVVSQQVLDEVVRNIKRKYPIGLPKLIKFLTTHPPVVQPDPSLQQTKKWLSVINSVDAPILAAAVSAKPKYLVTGDKKHFTIKVAQASRLTILSPKEFILLF